MMFFTALILTLFTLESSFEVEANSFKMDAFGNYFLYDEQFIEKRDISGKLIFRNSGIDYGTIHDIDLTNPLQPIVFYKEQGKIAFLDNTLSVQGNVIDLFSHGYGQIECVGGSRGDAFWLWDVNKTELVRVNRNFERQSSSGNLSLLLGRKITPHQIIENGNFVYVSDASYGVMIFDIYGNYRSGIPFKFEGDIEIENQRVIYYLGNTLNVISIDGFQNQSFTLPMEGFAALHFYNQKLHILKDGKISVFRFG